MSSELRAVSWGSRLASVKSARLKKEPYGTHRDKSVSSDFDDHASSGNARARHIHSYCSSRAGSMGMPEGAEMKRAGH
jgi:hypothetical protein